MTDMKARARELEKIQCVCYAENAERCPHAQYGGIDFRCTKRRDAIAAALVEARIAGLREATSLAEGKMSVLRCPYVADKPGDPTWDHTDDDVCPVCHKSGNESLHFCVEGKLGNFRAAIDARIAELTAHSSDPSP